MDLALKKEDEEFAASFREWLAEHLRRPPAFVDLADEVAWGREWQATLAADRWVGVHWPSSYGGRSATPVQVALYQSEYARAQAPQPVNRVGINLVGPTLLAHGTEDQRLRYLPPILSAEEIWCQLFSEPDAGSDLASLSTRADAGRGGLRGHGPQGLDVLRPVRLLGPVPGAHRCRRAAAPAGDHRADRRHVRPRRRRAPAGADDRRRRVQRGLPDRRLRAGGARGGDRGPGVDRGRLHAGPRARDELPVQGAGRPRGLPGPALRGGARATARWTTRWSPTRWRRRTSISTCCACTTCARSPGSGAGEEPGPESSWVKLTWTTMTQGLSDAALLVTGRDPTSAEAGPWARQWLWSKAAGIAGGTSQVQRDIIAGRILGLPAVADRRRAARPPRAGSATMPEVLVGAA